MAAPRRPSRRLGPLAAGLLLVALVSAACDGDTGRRASAPTSTTAAATSTSTAPPSTTTRPPEPATTTTVTAPATTRPPVPATTASTVPLTTPTTVSLAPLVPGPAPGGPMAGFAAFGDSGGGAAQPAVAAAISRWIAAGHRVDALVTTGDNVYDFGEPRFFVAQLDEPYRALRAARPMWVTLGNHDVMRGHGPAQLVHLGLPPLPYVATLPGVRLLFLDGNRPDAAQATWIGEQLDQPGPPFTAAVFHQPVYSCGIHGPTPEVVANWAPVLEARRVPLVLNGHEHQYSRFVSGNGVTYIVTGGGGRDLYALREGCAPPELRAAAVRHHFTAVEVFADRLVVSAVGIDDAVFDQAEIPLAVPAPVP